MPQNTWVNQIRSVFRSLEISEEIEGLITSSVQSESLSNINIPLDPVDWTTEFRFIKGEPFSFEGRPYLIDIYRDTSERAFLGKPRQMEITEFALNWLLYNLTLHPFTVGLYMSDRQDHVSVFSKLRLHSWGIEQSPQLKRLVAENEGNVSWQPFTNGSHLWMYSAWGDFEKARSIPVDFAVVDEFQSVNPEALPVLEEAMSKSKFKRIRIIGTGSDYGDGWHTKWMQGDQREWNPEKLIWEIHKSENSNYTHSYHISQTMAEWISAETIQTKRSKYTPRRFLNEVLGLWYKGARKPLIESEVRTLFDNTISLLSPEEVNYTLGDLYLGVDWGGGTKAYTIPWIWQCLDYELPRFRLVYVAKIEERSTEKQANMISTLMDNYKIKQAVMDAGGAPYQVQKLEERYPHTMLRCSYIRRPENVFEEFPQENRIIADRTWTIESIIDLITRPEQNILHPNGIPRIFIPSKEPEKVEWIIDHFTAIEAESVQLQSGKNYTTYTHPEELPDDALHACNYAYLAYLVEKKSRVSWFSV